MFKKIVLFLIFGVTFYVFPQENKFDTHSSVLEGELSEDDVFDQDFGRFDAYELQMEEGDVIKMRLTASFFPLMTIVAPSSEYKIAFPEDNKPEVIFTQEIDETGLWHIYIVGDSLDRGPHKLELCYISRSATEIPDNADFVTLVDFFLAHSKTNYFFLKGGDCKSENGEWNASIDSKGKYKSAKIIAENGNSELIVNFDSNMYNFDEIVSEIRKHLKKEWNIRISDDGNNIEIIEIEGVRHINLEKVGDKIVLKISIQ